MRRIHIRITNMQDHLCLMASLSIFFFLVFSSSIIFWCSLNLSRFASSFLKKHKIWACYHMPLPMGRTEMDFVSQSVCPWCPIQVFKSTMKNLMNEKYSSSGTHTSWPETSKVKVTGNRSETPSEFEFKNNDTHQCKCCQSVLLVEQRIISEKYSNSISFGSWIFFFFKSKPTSQAQFTARFSIRTQTTFF